MATDATGAPTPKGIPKYDTNNDAPSGLGFNATMDVIDTLLGWAKLRKNSAGAVLSRARLNLIEGSGVTITIADDAVDNEVDVTITSTAAGAGYGTSLPGSPTDGQKFILVNSITTPTFQWRFRFNAGSAHADKWEFVGGSPLLVEVATSENVTSSSYVDLTTVVSVTPPLAGVYDIKHGFWAQVDGAVPNTDAITGTIKIGAAAAGDGESAQIGGFPGFASVTRHIRRNFAAGTVLKQQYKSTNATARPIRDRWIAVHPVRVS